MPSLPQASKTAPPPARIELILPALNEESSIERVLAALPPGLFWRVLVVDNGSTDRTAALARDAGATVLAEPRRGYGSACLRALAALDPATQVVVFMDADASDVPSDAPRLIEPIVKDEQDLVLGSRTLGHAEAGSLTPHQRFGNWLATRLIRLFYSHSYTDLGPFRAIRAASLRTLEMRDPNYGWTIEMQIKALRKGLRVLEVPVSYRRRVGVSKISGRLKASAAAGVKILWTIARLARDAPP